MKNYTKRGLFCLLVSLMVGIFFNKEVGLGMMLSVILFGIGSRTPSNVRYSVLFLKGEHGEVVKKFIEEELE